MSKRSSSEEPSMQKSEVEEEDIKVIDFQDENKYFGKTRIAKEDTEFGEDHQDQEVPILAMRNVHKTYLLGIEGVPALRGVSLNIKRGEFVVIFGTSGGGKTTMLNIMGTIDKPTKGELRICGTRITNSTPDSELSNLRLSKLGFVFQTFNLLSSLSAIENVEMPMILHGALSSEERKSRAKELLNIVGMTPRLDHIPAQLSGGEQQRVTIARAIANSPEILLLDEPTGDLDTVNSLIVMKLLTDLNAEQNITMIMVTHDVGLKNFADRIIWLRDGKIQRIENTPAWKKKEALEKLNQDLHDISQKKKAPKPRPTVELRRPTDYTTHPKFKSRQVPSVDLGKDKEGKEELSHHTEETSVEIE